MLMRPAHFIVVDAQPVASPSADAIAARIRPRDLGEPLAAATREVGAFGLRGKALACALAAHAGLLAGLIVWRQSGQDSQAIEEIPVEIVVESAMIAAAPPVRRSEAMKPQISSAEPPLPMANAEPPPLSQPEPMKPEAAAPNVANPEPPVATLVPPPAAPMAPAPAVLAQQAAAERRAAETLRRKREDAARRRAEEQAREKTEARAEAETARKQEARRTAEHEKAARKNRERVASLAPAAPRAGAGDADAFDAASYRSVVARAVSAAVQRSCPSSGGGRVVVALTIGATGRIASASLSGSSGDGALDTAAVAAVRRAGPFPAPTGRSSVSVPVAVTCR